MNKFLTKVAKIFLGLSMAAGVGVAVSAGRKDASPVHAATESVTFSEQGYTSGNDVTSYTGTNFSIAFASGSKYYSTGAAIRVYAKKTFTVSSSNTLTDISLTFGSGDNSNAITTDSGTYSNGSWTGSATSVVFSIGGSSGHRRIASVSVTYTAGCDHVWDSGTVTTAATCETAGVMTYTCKECGETKTEPIAATGHTWGSGTVHDATCTEGGYTDYECTVCHEHKHEDETAALGHNFVNGECTRCHIEEPHSLDAVFGTTDGGDSDSSTSINSDTDLRNNYHYTVDTKLTFSDMSKFYPKDGKTIKLGTSSAPGGSFTVSIPSQINNQDVEITSVSLTTKKYGSDSVTVTVTADEETQGSFSVNSDSSFTKHDVDFSSEGQTSFTVTSTKRWYLQKLTVSYTTTSAATTLDAITSIGGTVTATLSQATTYNWDYSNLTVTGTLSGVSNQDVKDYVDITFNTTVPSSLGPCIVSVTATKKSTVEGNASPLTNNNISGEVEAAKLVYTFTMTQADLLQTDVSYINENAHAKSSTAECADHEDIEISWASNQVMKNSTDMQFQTTNGYLYNTTEIPGTITSVVVTATAQSFTVYYGNSEHPTSGTTPGGKFFTVQGNGSTPKASQIVVTFEVSDKPKVQLVATDLNVDVADGASTPVITDGSSAVTGYHLISEDPFVASITNDEKVQPVGYGTVVVSVSKEEDSGHIYLATSFVVTVGDHSKEVSTMRFTASAGGSSTANDGVEWSIAADASENEFSDVYGINYGTNNSKVSSLVFTTPIDEERIIKNVVVEAMSAATGSTITVTVGGTSFVCSKSNSLTGNISTFNFSGNLSGAITITMSGTASSKYGVKSISVLYVGDEATSFASTFLGAIACTQSGASKPTFNIKEGQTRWSWSLLETEYGNLSSADKAKFAKGATGVSSTVTECVERYDYIVGKYYVGNLDRELISSDFMSRSPSAVGVGSMPLLFAVNQKNTNTVAILVIISMVSVTAIGGYFFLRKRKENI